MNANIKYIKFLVLILVLSIPFYVWGAYFPVAGLPFGLPISFLMILVPFTLSVLFSWNESGTIGISRMFKSIIDYKKADKFILLFCILCMPIISILSFFTMKAFSLPLPAEIVIPYSEIPMMIVLYFIGAIPEELGWTYTLTEPLTESYDPIKTGIIIGSFWALWHVIPWSWVHPMWWIISMCILNVLMRTAMIYAYIYSGKSLFTGLIFHTMINVSMSTFPNNGTHMDPRILCIWMAVMLSMLLYYVHKRPLCTSYEYINNDISKY